MGIVYRHSAANTLSPRRYPAETHYKAEANLLAHHTNEAFLLVLSEQINVPKSRVQHVREREVDDAEHVTEWQRWFWLIRRERIKSFTFSSCEDEGQCFAREMSDLTHGRSSNERLANATPTRSASAIARNLKEEPRHQENADGLDQHSAAIHGQELSKIAHTQTSITRIN